MNHGKRAVLVIALGMFIFSINHIAYGKEIEGWSLGYDTKNYEIGIDKSVKKTGLASGYIKSQILPEQIGALRQFIKADNYIGKRVKFSAYVKTEIQSTVSRAEVYMNLWGIRNLIVGGLTNFSHIAKDNWSEKITDLPTKKSGDWYKYSVVMDIPEDCRLIEIGMTMHCKGQFWIDGASFEETEQSEAVNNTPRHELIMNTDFPVQPVNIDFE
jgi:hypothetical protein